MSSKRIFWATNLPDGTPLLVKGVLADVEDESRAVTISKRAAEIIEEVLAQRPPPTEMFVVPGIDLAHEVYRLVQAKHEAGIDVHDSLPPSTSQNDHEQERSPALGSEEIVDQTLLRLHRQATRFGRLLGENPGTVSLKDLRRSPLGLDLIFLSRVAKGVEHADSDKVFHTVDALLDLLFGTLSGDQYHIPGSFWEEPLGTMLSQAKLRAVDASELMSIGDATHRLGVTRPTIYRWMDDGTLDYVHDPAHSRVYVRRQDVEQLQGSQMFQADVGSSQDRPELAQID